MKMRISIKELNKLSDAQKEQLREWWTPQISDWYTNEFQEQDIVDAEYGATLSERSDIKAKCFPLLNIGQMIQFINEKKPLKSISKARFDKWIVNIETATLGYKDELCDSLWETITRII